mgnify:FL=1
MKYTMEALKPEHLDGLMEIEGASFSMPWSRDTFEYELEENSLAHYFVALDGDRVIGYGGFWAIVNEAHITNIAVHPDYRRKGVGNLIVNALMLNAIRMGITDLTLEVRRSNLGAKGLYEANGFRVEGTRKGYYQDTGEDALIMWRHL